MKHIKHILFMLGMILLYTGVSKAQVGLQDVIIETYYVANAADVAYADPLGADPLPAGAKTYRMYVDLAPGWEFQAIFGATNVGTGEIDTLVFRSTQPFWNHTILGKLYGYQTNVNDLDNHLVALDSWLSTGRSSGPSLANSRSCVMEVVPTEDTNGALPVHPHTPVNLLSHNDAEAGLPLTSEDGNIPHPGVPSPGVVTWSATPGIEDILEPLNAANDPALEMVVTDGALGVTDTLVGPNGANRICIGQFTTAGTFSGQINIQIRNITTLVVETYVAETPASGQFTHSALTFGPNALPTVTITAPADGADFAAGSTVNITATASDSDGAIDQVEFFKNGVSFAVVPFPGPYNASFVAGLTTETLLIEAVATDDGGATATDAINVDIIGNNPPVVDLTAPLTAITGTTVNISATATDPDGITQIEFFFNGTSIGVDNAPPYTASFTATPAGTFPIVATATDGFGATGSDNQNITISNNAAPTVNITSPASGAYVSQGPVAVSANAGDTDGSVTQVEFFANGVSIGVDNTGPAPFTTTWNAVYVGPFGQVDLTAVATDNLGLNTTSAIVAVNVINPAGSPYVVGSVDQVCTGETVCIPVKVIVAIDEVIGFDMVVEWDNSQIYPTGNVIKNGDLLATDLFETDNSINFSTEKMLVSVFLDVDAPFGTSFSGIGDLICIEFAKRPAFQAVDTTTIDITSFQESYFSGVQQKVVPSGDFTSFRNTIMTSTLEFWEDNSPIGYDGTNLITTIRANTSTDCSATSAASPSSLTGPTVNPDANGAFSYDLAFGQKLTMTKDIADATDVQELVNGFDALLTRRVIIDDAGFIPNVYQSIAMDVNRDGVISAGDVSQINQRAVLILDEFRQQWNYNADGSPKPSYSDSKDWQFIDLSTVLFNPGYQISSNYPQDNGVGFSKRRVPQVPFCLTTPVTHFATCPEIDEETYIGIMYGDVNGNWKNTTNLLLRSADAVNLEFDNVEFNQEFIDVPVSFTASGDVNAIDLNLGYDVNKLSFHSVIADNMQAVGHFNVNDGKLRITSNSLDVLVEGKAAFKVRFVKLTTSDINATDFNQAIGYLNGDKVNVNLVGRSSADNVVNFSVYPNPANDVLHIGISKDVTAEVIDINGKVVFSNIKVSANSNQQIDLSGLPAGMYTLRVYSDDYTSAQRFFVGK